MRHLLFYSLASVLLLTIIHPVHAQSVNTAWAYSVLKKVECSHGAVVSAHPLASAAGLAILQQGGNAFDAAIATQLVLAVVYPGAGNIGGGGFMVAHQAEGRNIALDFRERAPAAATRDMYLDAGGNPRTDLSQNGHLAAGIPGTVAGIFAELKYARLSFSDLIRPAIGLAEQGFIITASEAKGLNDSQSDFSKYSTISPVFVRTGGWKAGDTLIQPELAATLKLIRDKGARGFYEGRTAQLIIAEMQRGKGIITTEDLRSYQAIEREPTVFPYKRYTIVTMPLPSSGGVILQQMMKMVEDQPLKEYGFESVEAVHLMTEVERLAYADRAKYLGDKDFYSVPVKTLVSADYLKQRVATIKPGKAGNSEMIRAGVLDVKSEETTHLDVYDREGNAVSITTTLNNSYGSKVVVGGAGFLLNDEMDDFSIKAGVPNMYGAVGAEANAIVPGKRMLSSMTPTLVLDREKVSIVVGTPGGTTITTSVFQTLIDMLEFGMGAEEAVNKPKFHHQWLPDELYVERFFPENIRDGLRQMGYTVTPRENIGRTEVIRVADGKIVAVGDIRGDDTAAGY